MTTGDKNDIKTNLALVFSYLIFINSAVIALQEMLQICDNGWDYFTDFYNYLELTPIITTPLTMVLYLKEPELEKDYPWIIKARALTQVLSALFLWLNFMKFLRPFKSFGHLLRMIGQVFSDMSFFFVVFIVLVFAFGDAFYSESNGQKEDKYINNFSDALKFSYINAIGDFDTENFHGSLPWILFFMCTIFNLIVLMNLLIAIISDTYETVTATKE